jgi:hypothetical protein
MPSRSLTPTPGDPPPAGAIAPQLASDGIPAVALDAYRRAAADLARTDPSCGLSWPLLAAIGRVESDHGRFGGSQLYSDGTSAPRIIGIALNGHGTALIRDTDHGVLDGDTVYDHAVGPMQFIPSTWRRWGVDGNGDGVISPFNIYDAALAAADYLCAAGGNLNTTPGQIRAVLAYNDSAQYLATVLALEKIYASGAAGVTIPILPANPKPPPHERPLPPPVNPGPPLALAPTKPAKSPSGTASHTGAGSRAGPRSGAVSGSSGPPSSPPASRGSSTPPASTPTAVLTLTVTQGVAPLKVTADAAGSTPAASTTITKYTFTFGEGDPVTMTAGSDAIADHTYDTPGTYTVTLTVTDSAGKTADKTLPVTVNAPASTATSSGAASGSTASNGSNTAPSDTASALSVNP